MCRGVALQAVLLAALEARADLIQEPTGQPRIAEADTPPLVEEGCYYKDRQYMPFLPGTTWSETEDHHACQKMCQNITNCRFFSYWPDSKHCWLAGVNAVFEEAKGAITGPQECPKVLAGCTEVPGPEFPGATARESKLAWPSHRVPSTMECWPTGAKGDMYDSCPQVKVLEDTQMGWPGKCMGLKQVVVPMNETCESFCRKEVKCSVYQLVQPKPEDPVTCWHGYGSSGVDCYMRANDAQFAPLSAKRFLHGEVRVLKDLAGVQILGLSQAFDQNYFINVRPDAIKACRNVCYSNILCNYWQYFQKSGCWVEDPSAQGAVEFPLTKASWVQSSDPEKQAMAGEYIQHICNPRKAEWTAVAIDTTCSHDGTKSLMGLNETAVSVEECQARASADVECASLIFGDGLQTCGCVREGWSCARLRGASGCSLYELRSTGAASSQGKDALTPTGVPQPQGLSDSRWTNVKPAEAPDAGLVQGTMTVEGLDFNALSSPQKAVLSQRYADALASAGAVAAASSVKDMAGRPRSVTLEPAADGTGTQVRFQLPKGPGGNVTAPLSQAFLEEAQAVTLAICPDAVTKPLQLRAVTPAGRTALQSSALALPLAGEASQALGAPSLADKAPEPAQARHVSWWVYALLGSVVVGTVAALLAGCLLGGPRGSAKRKRHVELMDSICNLEFLRGGLSAAWKSSAGDGGQEDSESEEPLETSHSRHRLLRDTEVGLPDKAVAQQVVGRDAVERNILHREQPQQAGVQQWAVQAAAAVRGQLPGQGHGSAVAPQETGPRHWVSQAAATVKSHLPGHGSPQWLQAAAPGTTHTGKAAVAGPAGYSPAPVQEARGQVLAHAPFNLAATRQALAHSAGPAAA